MTRILANLNLVQTLTEWAYKDDDGSLGPIILFEICHPFYLSNIYKVVKHNTAMCCVPHYYWLVFCMYKRVLVRSNNFWCEESFVFWGGVLQWHSQLSSVPVLLLSRAWPLCQPRRLRLKSCHWWMERKQRNDERAWVARNRSPKSIWIVAGNE